ncbi:MAG TPA: PilZ domain-containing protein [Bryobacteraceae bacterium]|nr:PilZ domain-containing protein [Bryobacteraceae bacterium]
MQTKEILKTKENASIKTLVDRRGEPRMKANRPVTAHALPGRTWEACILDISAGGARLRSSAEIPPGTQVRLDAPGILLAGTVTRCDPEGGAYNVGVKLLRPLTMLEELARLNAALFSDDPA